MSRAIDRPEDVRPSRRRLLQWVAGAVPLSMGLLHGVSAQALVRREMPAGLAARYQSACSPDTFHARTVEEAMARLDRAGIGYDRTAVSASGLCPLCGCPIVSAVDPSGPAGFGPPPL
jgi:hypothetical protein